MTEVMPDVEKITDPQQLVENRVKEAISVLLTNIQEAKARGKSYIGELFGTMFGGKTKAALMLKERLVSEGHKVHVFKPWFENRYEVEEMQVASKDLVVSEATPVNGIRDIIDALNGREIKNGDCLILVEFPFMVKKGETADGQPKWDMEGLDLLIQTVRDRNIILIAEGLGYWFNTQPLKPVIHLLERCDIAFQMHAWVSDDPSKLAFGTLRYDQLSDQDGNLKALDVHARNLGKDILEAKDRVLERIKIIEEQLKDTLLRAVGLYLFPSHHGDPSLSIGGPESYSPVSKKYYMEVYAAFGMKIEVFDPWDMVNHYPVIHIWKDIQIP